MPVRPELRHFYGHAWRTAIRPRILERAGNACERCRRPWKPIDVAHLDGNPANMDDDNLAALCRRCHRANDYELWAARCRETRAARKDAARPMQWEGAIAV